MAHSDFDPEIEQLAKAHEKAETTMLSLILSFLTGKATYEQATQGIGQIAQALAQASAEWVQNTLPKIYADGVREAQKALESDEDASGGSPNTQAHGASLRLFQEDLSERLAATTMNVSADAKRSLREIARRKIAATLEGGKNARAVAPDMAREMEEKGVRFVDNSGRRLNSRAYSTMVLRDATVDVSNEANLNAAREFGSPGVRVFDGNGGDTDAECVEANGQYWSLLFAAANKRAHPHCRRAFSPLPSTFTGKLDRE